MGPERVMERALALEGRASVDDLQTAVTLLRALLPTTPEGTL